MAGKLFQASGPIGLMLTLLLGLSNSHCGKEKFPEYVDMRLVFPAAIKAPIQVNIGDTIELEINFADTVYELNTDQYYKIVDMDFKESLGILKLVTPTLTISEQPGAMNQFTILNQKGSISANQTFSDLKFLYVNNHYVYKGKLIANNPGIFAINFLWPVQLHEGFDEKLHLEKYIDLGTNAEGVKKIPKHVATYTVINNGKTNFDLFRANCRAISLEVPIDDNIYYEQKGTFTFQVVE